MMFSEHWSQRDLGCAHTAEAWVMDRCKPVLRREWHWLLKSASLISMATRSLWTAGWRRLPETKPRFHVDRSKQAAQRLGRFGVRAGVSHGLWPAAARLFLDLPGAGAGFINRFGLKAVTYAAERSEER